MGQYYKVIILADSEEYVRFYIEITYGNGMKLMEHSYINNPFMNKIEELFSLGGPFYKSRIVWAGDYANEESCGKNLYVIAQEKSKEYKVNEYTKIETRYLVNYTKKQYVDLRKCLIIHPLPLLTAEGNGKGGGDYYGSKQNNVGIWARDSISFELETKDFTEFFPQFHESDCTE